MESRIQIAQLFKPADPMVLECGDKLESVQVAYETYGESNDNGSNTILICHALTGDAHAAGKLKMLNELQQSIPFYQGMKADQPGWWDGARTDR